MRKIEIGVFVLIVLGLAFAQDPIAKVDSVVASSNDMNVEIAWRQSGMYPQTQIHNMAFAYAEATYVCLDRSGRMKVADQENRSEWSTVEADFTATKRGTAHGKFVLKPPSEGMFNCAPDQDLQLACASYSQLKFRDDTHDLEQPVKQRFVTYKPGYAEFCALDLR